MIYAQRSQRPVQGSRKEGEMKKLKNNTGAGVLEILIAVLAVTGLVFMILTYPG